MFKKTISKCLVFAMLLATFIPSTVHAASIDVERIAGASRYETAVLVSQYSYWSANNVIIASGENFADALSGGQLAVSAKAPILLTPANKLDAGVKEEIKRLNASTVYILGGEKAVSAEVENELKKDYDVERLSGADRYATSLEIAKKSRLFGSSNDTVFASGEVFADALAAGTFVVDRWSSLVLSPKNALPAIATNQTLVLGGTKHLPLPGYTGERIAGADRYQTARQLSEYTYPGSSLSGRMVLVDGTNYPDALSAITIARGAGAPILLTHPKGLDPETRAYIKNNATKVIIVGGTNSVSDSVVADLTTAAQEWTITFARNDGSSTGENRLVRSGEKVEPPYFELDEHVFIEWNTKADGTGEAIDFDTKVHTSNLTVFAIWKRETAKHFFSVTDSGSGAMVTGYDDAGPKDVVIPNRLPFGSDMPEVRIIAENSFRAKGLTSVILPPYITAIGVDAFVENDLTKIVFPKAVTTIEAGAFRDNKITQVTLPKGLTTVRPYIFYKNKLKTITIPDGVTSIGEKAFTANELTTVSIPGSVETIGLGAFGANKIKTLVLPEGLKKIEKYGFNMNNMESVTFPSTLTHIGPEAFRFNKLKSVTLPPKLKAVDVGSFADGVLEKVVFPEGLESIGKSAFGINKLQSVVIPNSVTTISSHAFDFNQIKELKLSNKLEVIPVGVFHSNLLETVAIPDSVKEIKENAFTKNKLTKVEVKTGCVVHPNAFDPGVTVTFR